MPGMNNDEIIRLVLEKDGFEGLDDLAEKAKKARGEASELMDILIVYRWPHDIFPDFTQDPSRL